MHAFGVFFLLFVRNVIVRRLAELIHRTLLSQQYLLLSVIALHCQMGQ